MEKNFLAIPQMDDNQEIEVINSNNLDIISEDEKEVIDEAEQALYRDARDRGYFNVAIGMSNITGMLDNAIFAEKIVDDSGGVVIRYTQKYTDGEFLPVLEMRQSELLAAAAYQFDYTSIQMPNVRRRVARFMEKVIFDYMDRVRPNEMKNPNEILAMLVKALPYLPENRVGTSKLTRERFYERIIETLREAHMTELFEYIRRNSYYMLTDEMLTTVADKLGMTSKALLNKLAEYRFLYLTESSRGYQTKVRTTATGTEWMYCIVRLDYLGQPKKVEPLMDPKV